MGMSTHVSGYKPPDEHYQKLAEVYRACKAADLDIPEEVETFFDGDAPDPEGTEVAIESHEWTDNEYRQGIQVHVDDIPEGVTVLRFYNAW